MDAFIAISRNPNPNTLKDSNSSIVLSTSTRSSPFHPHNRLQHHVAVYLSPGHEHHEHNPSASGVAYQANTSRKRKPPSSPEPSQSRPKPTRIPRSVPTANSSARRLPPPSQDVDLLPCPGEVVYHNVKAIKTLCQLPPTCQVSDVKLEPSLNKVAEKEPRFIDRRIIYQAWREFHNQDSQLTFLEAVGRVPDHAPWPGSPRILGNEADAKEAFIVNTLAPILSIVNCFLPEQYRKLLEIQLFSEVSSVDKTRMDIIIMLVDKRKDKDGLRLLKYKKPLVFVEAKRHNLVDGTGWPIIQGCVQRPLKYETGQIRALLPQVFM
ncbi:uncharacterized protein JCM6883_003015 [Sporobolomyces salmoneus]|uniref:uncharacterized protein n=1 Tax=Sporobolomyces salmoneus TaxID=183962 RepID=UPI00317F6814